MITSVVVSRAVLDAYIDGKLAMPLDRQLCLALFVIEKVPRLARIGHQLRGQVAAAIAYDERATETHTFPPPSKLW
ncbi:MAG TPA: hypothetical protein VG434_02365 [Sphingomicrobium sp.]|nr:hypothetical protein [Sphingomicrobium sp.]